MFCEKFKCLPSQLEKEDAKTIDMFLAIDNELHIKERNRIREERAEAKLKEMMGK